MKTKFAVILAFFLLFPLVSAATTQITVKTLPAHDVFISVTKPSSENYESIVIKKLRADAKGMVEYTFTDDANLNFGLRVVVKWFDERKFDKAFGPFTAGAPVYVEVLPEGYVDYSELEENNTNTETSTNESSANATATAQEAQENESAETIPATNNTALTGNVISNATSNKNLLNTAYYVGGAILLIAIISFVVATVTARKRKRNVHYGMQPVKFKRPRETYGSLPTDEELGKIEKEIESVEKEITQYKTRSRLSEAEKRLNEKRQLLEQLKKKDSQQPSQTKPAEPSFQSTLADNSQNPHQGDLDKYRKRL